MESAERPGFTAAKTIPYYWTFNTTKLPSFHNCLWATETAYVFVQDISGNTVVESMHLAPVSW